MIKINLNKTRSGVDTEVSSRKSKTKATSSVLTGFQTALEEKLSSFGPSFYIKIVVNIICILCFPLGLKVYEVKQINKLKAQKQKEELLLNQANQKLTVLKNKLNSYGYLKEKSKEFEKKKQFLSQLTKERLIIPSILDFIQDHLPNTVWLKNIEIDVSEKKKNIKISGESFKEAGVNIFARTLEQILDENSITVNMRDVKEGNSVLKVSFDLKGEI